MENWGPQGKIESHSLFVTPDIWLILKGYMLLCTLEFYVLYYICQNTYMNHLLYLLFVINFNKMMIYYFTNDLPKILYWHISILNLPYIYINHGKYFCLEPLVVYVILFFTYNYINYTLTHTYKTNDKEIKWLSFLNR